jgi:protein-disulfide isomerase
VGLTLVTLLAAVSCAGTAKEERTEDPAGNGPHAGTDLDHPSLGDEDAPVALIEYADYQ